MLQRSLAYLGAFLGGLALEREDDGVVAVDGDGHQREDRRVHAHVLKHLRAM